MVSAHLVILTWILQIFMHSTSAFLTETTVGHCGDLSGDSGDGEYVLSVSNVTFPVYCDMTTVGGGWTVIQRRIDASVNFYRNWATYESGFGDLQNNFWLGLTYIHLLTTSQEYSLRIELDDWDNSTAHAVYDSFSINGADDNYRLKISGYHGTANDDMTAHYNLNNIEFSTGDRDHDHVSAYNCAQYHLGPWWHHPRCAWSNLNGRYRDANYTGHTGIYWYHWKNSWRSMRRAEMKIRPRS